MVEDLSKRERFIVVMSGGKISLKLSYDGRGVLRGTETYAGVPGDQYWIDNYEGRIPTRIDVKEEVGFVMPNGFIYMYPADGSMPPATEYVGKDEKRKSPTYSISEVRKLA